MFRFLAFAIILFTFSACKYSDEPKVFDNENIHLEYPSYLNKNKQVYPQENNVISAQNDYRDVYFFVADLGQKPGSNGFNITFDNITKQLLTNVRDALLEQDTSYTLSNGLTTRRAIISGIVASKNQEKRMLFFVNLYEDKQHNLYQLTSWIFRHKRSVWENDLNSIANSFSVK
ncbi:MAG: hypothetical protein H6553_12060 [Chitinophagales bacterium]|nr:hypothetical protein [Chitinophagales bacterium]